MQFEEVDFTPSADLDFRRWLISMIMVIKLSIISVPKATFFDHTRFQNYSTIPML
jgi:hypothetical protein